MSLFSPGLGTVRTVFMTLTRGVHQTSRTVSFLRTFTGPPTVLVWRLVGSQEEVDFTEVKR